MARLVVMTPDGEQREHDLRAFNTLGRHPEQTIQILDRVVSKEHALITSADGGYWLQDIGSRNGTFVNGVQIAGRTRLVDGDTISMGSTRIFFVTDDTSTTVRQLSGNVTIHALAAETAIRSRVQAMGAQQNQFLPEADIVDEQTIRADYEKLRILFELNKAIGTEKNQEEILDRILDKAFECSGADRGVILLLNENGEPEPRAYKNRRGTDDQMEISNTILKEVLEQHHAVLSSDATMDSRFGGSHSIIMQGIRSTMCVPLMADSEILGMIHLDTRIATGVFTEKDLQILTVFANEAALRIAHARLTLQSESEAVVRNNLSRLLSPNLVEEVVRGDIAVEKGGTLRDVSVLFIDIRGFTAMSERLEPTAVVSLLNEFFEIMVEIVFRHEGTLDKFIGDELMAVWGAPMSQDDHMERAVRAAVEMKHSLDEFNRFRQANNEIVILARTGIASGQVTAGYMGSSQTMSYTVIGDTVNTASRLCSHADTGQILVTDNVIRDLGPFLTVDELGPVHFKGKSLAIPVFNITNIREKGDEPPSVEDV